MREPSHAAPPTSAGAAPTPAGTGASGASGAAKPRRDRVELLLYALAFATYVPAAIYVKFMLDWIVGPVWLVAWVWGGPALVRLVRHEPIRPRRTRIGGAG